MEAGVGQYEGVQVEVGPSCHEPGCKGYGTMNSKVLFLGIAPGKDEVKTGRPLTGPSGMLLDAVLEGLSCSRKDYYATNMICWWKDDPSREEAARCHQRLVNEIKLMAPKFIVVLGSLVADIFMEHLTLGRSFSKVRGGVFWSDVYNCYVMATYHPAGILRGMGQYGATKDDKASALIYDFVRDLRKMAEVVEWAPGARQSDIDYTVVSSSTEAQNVLKYLSTLHGEPVALDVETTYNKDDEEVDVFGSDKVLCVGVGTSEKAWVFTPEALFDKDGNPVLEWPDNVCWTMHNSMFDVQIMRKYLGVWIEVHEDTMLQSYTLDERSGVHKLKSLAREFLACGFYEEDRFGKRQRVQDKPSDSLYEYNARDVVYTARLCLRFREQQDNDNVRGFYEELLIPAVNMYKELQYHGVKIDQDLHKRLMIMWIEKWMKEEEDLCLLAEDLGWTKGRINLNSGQQLAEMLFDIIGLPVTKKTKAGARSVDKEVLERLQGSCEFVNRLIEFRFLTKRITGYGIALHNQLKSDGRAHAVVKLHGTGTGRPSYTKPAMQTFPAPFDDNEEHVQYEFTRLRELVVPTEQDHVIIEADYGKAEIWNAYGYSGDEVMYSDLISGDYHARTGANAFKKPIEKVTKEDRTKSKRITFGIMYDREAPSLSKAINSTVQEAQEYINAFFRRNKKYHKWFRSVQEEIIRTGELVSKTGRKRRIIILDNAVRAAKQAVNFPIQSTSSDVVLAAAIKIHKAIKESGLRAHLLFTVHDSIVAQAHRDDQDAVWHLMHDIMIAKHFDGVPQIPAEIKIGVNWGIAKPIHDCADSYCIWSKEQSQEA